MSARNRGTARERRGEVPSPILGPVIGALLLGVMLAACSSAAPPAATSRWEPDIQAFEAADQEHPPAPGGVLFVGSSSIRMWETLEEDFEGLPVLNRGFGGSQMSDVVEFADRIVLPYRPRAIVVYAGDNDLWEGDTPQQVLEDFQSFVRIVHAELPETPIAYIAVKPSVARWSIVDRIRETNDLIRRFTETDPRLEFIDIYTPMLRSDGTPDPALFIEDGLHLNARGYDLWESIVEPVVRKMAGS